MTDSLIDFYNSTSELTVPDGMACARFDHPVLGVSKIGVYSALSEIFVDVINDLDTVEVRVFNRDPALLGSAHIRGLDMGVDKRGQLFIENTLPYTSPPPRSNALASVGGVDAPDAVLGSMSSIKIAGVQHQELDLSRALRIYLRVPPTIQKLSVHSSVYGPVVIRGMFDQTDLDIAPGKGRVSFTM